MKTNTILIILLFSFINLNAQKVVPNFAVTDIYGEKHELFRDYLDNGKYVFIDFFTTTCGSCETLAPKVDTVYRDFGCNYGDIVFLGIDAGYYGNYGTDSSIWEFTRKFDMTFPAVSGLEGGGYYVFHDLYDYQYTPYKILISDEKEIVTDNMIINNASDLRDSILTFGLEEQLCEGNNFMFYSLISKKDSIVGTINADEKTIELNFSTKTDLTSLVANFRNAANSTIQINEINQISGETKNDFTSPIIYKITSETGVEESWTVNVSTSVNMKYLNNKFNIYPNPSSGIFILENKYYFNNNLEHTQGSITNISGKTIQNITLNEQDVIIDLSDYPKGIYFINIETEVGVVCKRIILL